MADEYAANPFFFDFLLPCAHGVLPAAKGRQVYLDLSPSNRRSFSLCSNQHHRRLGDSLADRIEKLRLNDAYTTRTGELAQFQQKGEAAWKPLEKIDIAVDVLPGEVPARQWLRVTPKAERMNTAHFIMKYQPMDRNIRRCEDTVILNGQLLYPKTKFCPP